MERNSFGREILLNRVLREIAVARHERVTDIVPVSDDRARQDGRVRRG
jgi:hypothetical protein